MPLFEPMVLGLVDTVEGSEGFCGAILNECMRYNAENERWSSKVVER
jgi:hypothetical protein